MNTEADVDVFSHTSSQESIETVLKQSISELSQRWLRCRVSALKSIKIDNENLFFEKMHELSDSEYEELLKIVFLNSRNLGLSYQKKLDIVWERVDFARHFASLGSPCAQGEWDIRSTSNVLTRKGCVGGRQFGARYCQYWREAIDGLVSGLGDDTGYMRHSCISVNDEVCVDVFYQEESIPTDAIWRNEMRWGPLPAELKEKLLHLEKKFERMKVGLSFLGLSEKNLFYKLEPKENLTCGTSGTIYRGLLEKWIEENAPYLQLKDASPVAVYGEKT